jgi:hypothetical protein
MEPFDVDSCGLIEVGTIIENLDLSNSYMVIGNDTKIVSQKLAYFAGSSSNNLVPARFPAIKKILSSAATSYLTGTQRPYTLKGIIESSLRMMRWADRHGLADPFVSKENYLDALKSHINHLQGHLTQGKLTEHTVATSTINCMTVGQWAFDVEQEFFLASIKRVKRKTKNLDSATEPPPYHVLKESYSLNKRLFEELSSFLLAHREFPHQISLPKERLWVLPTKSWGATEEILATLPSWGKSKVWNYRTGKIYSALEAMAFSDVDPSKSKYRCQEKIYKEQRGLDLANKNFSCWQRIILAQWAHDSFVSLFAANTSANESAIRYFPWDYSLELRNCIHKKSPKLRTIKYRAHGKEVAFEIRANALGLFEKFLRLREYILQGREHKYLFISLNRENELSSLPAGALGRHYKRIRAQLYPNFKGVGYREWRANGGTTVFDAAGVNSAAKILQTSSRSIIRSYSKGTIENWEKDLTAYFNAFAAEFKNYKAQKIPIGHCYGEGAPTALDEVEPMRPNCTHFEGCLNCSQYSLHADEEDIRKLLSMQYVILESEPAAKSKEHFDHVFKNILRKIEWILGEISLLSAETKNLVDQIQTDIFENEELTEYWQLKLDMLVEMGVIQ